MDLIQDLIAHRVKASAWNSRVGSAHKLFSVYAVANRNHVREQMHLGPVTAALLGERMGRFVRSGTLARATTQSMYSLIKLACLPSLFRYTPPN